MGIYKRKHDFDQESDQIKKEKNRITVKKKERKHAQESKIQEKAITIKKKEGRKWKTPMRIKHYASFL